MKTLQKINTTTLTLIQSNIDSRKTGIPVKWDNVTDDFQPSELEENEAWAIVTDTYPEYDSLIETVERKVFQDGDDWVYGWVKRSLTELEIEQNQPNPLIEARSAMSQLLASLPVESRAKFADSRAGIENMLDLEDFEGAHYRVGQIDVDSGVETTAKNAILAGLSNFI